MVEDDSQDGADHVDGHRAPVQVISPWAQHGKVDSTYYSQITMVRTIEQILGAQPLNQKLAAATPMYGAFTDKPDSRRSRRVPQPGAADRGRHHRRRPAATDTLGTDRCGGRRGSPRSRRPQAAVPDAQQDVAGQWAAWAQEPALHRHLGRAGLRRTRSR